MKRRSCGRSFLCAIDKPAGMTSHDVIDRLRRITGESRIGHAGTLDPFATGVLLVGVGQATRLLPYATLDFKSYVARIVWGFETTTDDSCGELRRSAVVPREVCERSWAREACKSLLDVKEQIPPDFCAVKVAGTRSYTRARQGQATILAPRPVEIRACDLLDLGCDEGRPWWDIECTVSKGTYIRALARDLGRTLGSAAHLGALRRTASGVVTLSACVSLDDVRSLDDLMDKALINPLDVLGMPYIRIQDGLLDDVRCARAFDIADVEEGCTCDFAEHALFAIVCGDVLYALAERHTTSICPRKVFAEGILCGRAQAFFG